MRQVLSNLELKLQGKRFLAGENITLADISAVCNLSLLEMVSFDVSPWPRFLQWRDDIKATKQYKIVHEGFEAFKRRSKERRRKQVPSESPSHSNRKQGRTPILTTTVDCRLTMTLLQMERIGLPSYLRHKN